MNIDDIDIQAARKLVDDIGLRPAARHYDIDHNKLRRLLSNTTAQESEAAPEAAPDSYRYSLIRRHENETRNRQGLPPLSDKEWAIEKAKLQECERQMEQFWPNGWKHD